MVNPVERDPELKRAFDNADLVLTDSIGVISGRLKRSTEMAWRKWVISE